MTLCPRTVSVSPAIVVVTAAVVVVDTAFPAFIAAIVVAVVVVVNSVVVQYGLKWTLSGAQCANLLKLFIWKSEFECIR